MSGREWKPGDVAWIRVGTGDWEIGLRQDDRAWACAHTSARREHEEVLVSHPLVVIDPEDREQVERLGKTFHESDHLAPWHDLHSETRATICDAMQAALRSLATAPKPEEPTGLGAVVEDADGYRWVYSGGPQPAEGMVWFSPDLNGTALYTEITAVRVLSEGVTA